MSQHASSMIAEKTGQPLPIFLALEIRQIPIICVWLDMRIIGLLDIAMSSRSARKIWLTTLKSIRSKVICVWHHSHSSMKWVMTRNIRVNQILANRNCRNRMSDLTFEDIDISGSPTTYGEEVENDSILSKWEGRRYLQLIDLSHCHGITDISISALVDGCSQLHTINLSGCEAITDIGISALGSGCGQLHTINLID